MSTAAQTRQTGFYWVRRLIVSSTSFPADWEVAEWHSGNWWLTGSERYLSDTDLAEIDERPIQRQP